MAKKKTIKKEVSKKSAIKDIQVNDSKEIVDKKVTKDKKKVAVVTLKLDGGVQQVFVKPKFNYLKAQGVK
tara:strand:+ start:157 stop:366 length:210 start_codon:yes stop_codon:yes gene_type:complete